MNNKEETKPIKPILPKRKKRRKPRKPKVKPTKNPIKISQKFIKRYIMPILMVAVEEVARLYIRTKRVKRKVRRRKKQT